MYRKFLVTFAALMLLTSFGCMESMVKPEAKTDTGEEMGLPPYSGPRHGPPWPTFEWKVGGSGSSTKMSFGGQTVEVEHSRNSGYTTGLRDMLTTAMVQSQRYRVLERQNLSSLEKEMALVNKGLTDKSGVQKGQVKGADLLIMGRHYRMGSCHVRRRRQFGRRHAGQGIGSFLVVSKALSKNLQWPWISVLWIRPHLKCWRPPV